MCHAFSRTELLIGKDGLERLKNSRVAVFGVGGVGSFTVEALARSGLGSFVLVDRDVVELSNLNRQLHATSQTIGRPKVDLMKERILSINPSAQVTSYQSFYRAENADEMIKDDYDYVVDAIDTISAKIDLAVRCQARGIPIIACMGAGNKLDPTSFRVADIYKTSVDPIARVMRHELRKRGVKSLKVVYSTETPIKPDPLMVEGQAALDSQSSSIKKRATPASIAFVPSVAGLILAGEVIKDIIGLA